MSSSTASLTAEQIKALGEIDSPTIANAIEAFDVRDRTDGYSSRDLKCLFRELPPVIGYAVTCTVDSTTPGKGHPNRLLELFEVVAAAPKPAIVVMQDIGPHPLLGCHAGDVLSTTFQRLGAVGLITDSSVRDLAGVRVRAPGFQLFAQGEVVSHGTSRVVEIGAIVTVCGLTVRPGDLLHGDANGVVSIPLSIAGQVAAQSQKVWDKEREQIGFIKGDTFTLDGLRKLLSH
jgi:regulator of RNase E activity RraA